MLVDLCQLSVMLCELWSFVGLCWLWHGWSVYSLSGVLCCFVGLWLIVCASFGSASVSSGWYGQLSYGSQSVRQSGSQVQQSSAVRDSYEKAVSARYGV